MKAPRTLTPWATTIVMGCLALLVAALSASSAPPAGPGTAVPGAGHGAAATPSLAATLVLATRSVRAGGTLTGHVVVWNDTGHAMRVDACQSVYQVLLASASYKPGPKWLTCLKVVTIPPGRSSYPVTARATYDRCSPRATGGGVLPCTRTGAMPALPPGAYQATGFAQPGELPVPAPIPVRVIP